MKIEILNDATPIAVAFIGFDEEDYAAPYNFASINDALAYVEEQIDERQQYAGACIYHAETGEAYVICEADEAEGEDGDYDYEPDLEMGFNPYLGCYDYDC